jgi:hypothetical protein
MLGTQNVNSEDDLDNNRALPGQYHVAVQSVDESFEKGDKVIVEFQVLAGTTPGQTRKTITEYYSVSEKALPRLQRLALATGLLQPNEPEREVQLSDAEGRQLVIEVEEHSYEKKEDGKTVDTVRISWMGMWSIGNPAVADVPKDGDALKLLPGALPGQSNPPAAPPATQQAKAPVQPPPAGGSAASNKFADL